MAVLLAASLGLSVLALSIGAARELANPKGAISQEAASILATVLGALVGGLSGYLSSGKNEPGEKKPANSDQIGPD